MTALVVFALAALSATGPSADPAASGKPAAPTAAQPAPTQRYCYRYEITGSMVPQRTCKTYEQWKKEGVDPTAVQH